MHVSNLKMASPPLQEKEEILWTGMPKVPRRLQGLFTLGLFAVGGVVYFALIMNVLPALYLGVIAEFALPLSLAFYFPSRNSQYQITTTRAVVIRRGIAYRSALLEDIDLTILLNWGFLGFATLTIGCQQESKWHSPNWFAFPLLRKAEADAAKEVIEEAKYAKEKGLI